MADGAVWLIKLLPTAYFTGPIQTEPYYIGGGMSGLLGKVQAYIDTLRVLCKV